MAASGIGGHQNGSYKEYGKDEWITPKEIVLPLGEFDLDPCASVPRPWDTAKNHYTIFDGGLLKPWFGRVWLNPPYSDVPTWIGRLAAHGNGIALTPDRTSADWFRAAWAQADLALFMPKVKFIRPDGSEGKQPSNGTCLWASGERACQALRKAAPMLGILAIPERIAP